MKEDVICIFLIWLTGRILKIFHPNHFILDTRRNRVLKLVASKCCWKRHQIVLFQFIVSLTYYFYWMYWIRSVPSSFPKCTSSPLTSIFPRLSDQNLKNRSRNDDDNLNLKQKFSSGVRNAALCTTEEHLQTSPVNMLSFIWVGVSTLPPSDFSSVQYFYTLNAPVCGWIKTEQTLCVGKLATHP